MALEYFPFYHSYKKKTEKLTDQELGRLVRALVTFSETGELQELAGRESIAFDFIAVDIQNAKEAYEEKCAKNKANRERPLTNDNDRERTITTVDDRDQTKTKTKTKEELKEKNSKDSFPPPSPSELFSGDLLEAVQDWLTYKKEKRQSYQPTGLRSLFSQLRKAADQHGEAAVVDVIRNSIASNYAGITLDRLANTAYKPATGNRVVASNNSSRDPVDLEKLQAIIDKI